jgi:hypothetical protein
MGEEVSRDGVADLGDRTAAAHPPGERRRDPDKLDLDLRSAEPCGVHGAGGDSVRVEEKVLELERVASQNGLRIVLPASPIGGAEVSIAEAEDVLGPVVPRGADDGREVCSRPPRRS